MRCPSHIESLAKYDYDWTDGLGYKFERSADLGSGVVRYTGNNVKFQNGFGAWLIMDYSCDLDVNSMTVVAYDVTGR